MCECVCLFCENFTNKIPILPRAQKEKFNFYLQRGIRTKQCLNCVLYKFSNSMAATATAPSRHANAKLEQLKNKTSATATHRCYAIIKNNTYAMWKTTAFEKLQLLNIHTHSHSSNSGMVDDGINCASAAAATFHCFMFRCAYVCFRCVLIIASNYACVCLCLDAFAFILTRDVHNVMCMPLHEHLYASKLQFCNKKHTQTAEKKRDRVRISRVCAPGHFPQNRKTNIQKILHFHFHFIVKHFMNVFFIVVIRSFMKRTKTKKRTLIECYINCNECACTWRISMILSNNKINFLINQCSFICAVECG